MFRNYSELFGTIPSLVGLICFVLFDIISLLFCVILDYFGDALMNLGFHNHVCNEANPGIAN